MVFKIFLIITILFFPFVAQGASLIDINTAPSEELEKIIGIGPVLAQRTIEARPFNSLDDLIKVKGIGEITLQKIKDQGLAWAGPQEELEPNPEPEPEPESEPDKKTTPITYPTGIVFNEILPSPEGADAENEWLELKNTNNQEVDISDWKIQDTIGSTKTYIFPEGTKIKTQGYLVLTRPVSKITLNNTGDGLNLTNPNGKIVDSVDFGKAFLNQSYSKTSSGWAWNSNLTPGTKNIVPKEKPSLAKASGDEKKSETGSLSTSEEKTADINLSTQKSKPPVWLIASIVAIVSGIAILIVKNSLILN